MTQVDYVQSLMDEVYDFWQKSSLTREEVLSKFSEKHQAAVRLGNLNYQVENGGFSQWECNEYNEDLEELLTICDRGIALGLEDFKVIKELLVEYKEMPEYESDTEETDCYSCDGTGTIEEYDEDEDEVINETCEECGGDGYFSEETNNEDERAEIFDKLDDRYYALENRLQQMDELIRRWDEVQDSEIKEFNVYAETDKKPICNLKGVDGNVFFIIGHVSKTLKRAGLRDKAEEFREKATQQESYDAVLRLLFDYVDVRFQ